MKFKIGDKVRIKCDRDSVGAKYNYRDTEGVISDIDAKFMYPYSLHDNQWAWRDSELELIEDSSDIKRVIFNPPVTVIIWKDGTRTLSKCMPGDKYDKEKGFVIAYLKKLMGVTAFKSELDKWCNPEAKIVKQSTYAVGDKVKIIDHRRAGWNMFGFMDEYMDNILTIKTVEHVSDATLYTLKECPLWFWSANDFVGKVIE